MRLARDSTVLEVNQTGLALGLTSGQSFLDSATPAYQDQLRDFVSGTGGRLRSGPMSFETAPVEGVTRWLDVYAARLPDVDELGSTVLVIVLDSTENHLNISRRKESDSLLRGVLDFAPVAIAIKDVDSCYLDFNPAAERAYGFKSEEAKGKSTYNFYSLETAEALIAHDRYVVETKQTTERQHMMMTTNGERLISSLKFPLLNSDDEVIAVCSISMDLTEQREFETKLAESERRFRDFANIAADWFWEMDADFRFSYQSERFEEITGIPTSSVIGRTREAAFKGHIDDTEKWKRHFTAMESHQPYEMEWEVQRDDGSRRILLTTARPHFDDNGVFQGYRGVGRDVTEMRQSERLRESLIAELETKNTELEQFSYTVSHDLKSPLLTIKGFLGLLEQDVETGDKATIQGDLERIRTAADRMQVLLRDLLELSQVGHVGGPEETIDLQVLLNEVTGILAGAFDTRRVELKVLSSLPLVRGDRTRLAQVFQNLLENAVRFLGDQPDPSIEIGCMKTDDLVTLFVRDNGMGIEPRYHDRIFTLFERLESRRRGHRGWSRAHQADCRAPWGRDLGRVRRHPAKRRNLSVYPPPRQPKLVVTTGGVFWRPLSRRVVVR